MAALACVALLALSTDAPAAPSVKKSIWGPIQVDGVSQFPIYSDLGVGIYQYTLNWPANRADSALQPARSGRSPRTAGQPSSTAQSPRLDRGGIRVSAPAQPSAGLG